MIWRRSMRSVDLRFVVESDEFSQRRTSGVLETHLITMEPLMNHINSYERATQQSIPVATQNKGNGRSNKLLALSMSVVVVEFYDDILIGILCRLPCKSAMRLKCVCNRWLRLISSGTFIGQFAKHHTSIGTKEAWPVQ
ncbi:hypothetical protein AKJ16_DCAP22601 [Drosera capensis]